MGWVRLLNVLLAEYLAEYLVTNDKQRRTVDD